MAGADYIHGEMDIAEQARTWDGFMKGSLWGGMIIMLVIAYATFAVAIGMHWMIALALCAGAGIIGGLLMGMGGAWIATVIGLSALAVIAQICIAVFGWLT